MIASIAELPFVERPAAELLGIVVGREGVDEDFEGFGWARLDEVVLEDEAGVLVVRDALVLALHSAEDTEDACDPDLELRVGDEVLLVALSRFLSVWAARLPRAPRWVLALCNARGATLSRPAAVPEGIELWYALGDVDSFAEHRAGAPDRYGLAAKSWLRSP